MNNHIINPSDIVHHIPSGETWVVCGVNYDTGHLVPCGYPFPSIAKIADCELVKERYSIEGQPDEYIKTLRSYGMDSYIYCDKSKM